MTQLQSLFVNQSHASRHCMPRPPEINLKGLHWSLPCFSQAFFQFKEGPHFFCLRVFAHALLRTFHLLLLSLRTRAHSGGPLTYMYLSHAHPRQHEPLPNILSPSILLFSYLVFISVRPSTMKAGSISILD